jgi:glycosyltransferase involved in cell wall biosynthesis
MQRILYINGGRMMNGGIEAYMMNYYRHLDRTKFQIDFVVHGFERGIQDDEIEKLGGKIYRVPVKSKNPLKNYLALKKILKSGEYKIVHSHMDAMSVVPLKIAKKCGVPVRIAHSHNMAHLTNNPLKIKLNDMAKKNLPASATHLFACSRGAGEWLFGAENKNRVEIIPNAIDVEKIAFNARIRQEIRRELKIADDEICVGHVGRFEYQKNHEFLVEAFAELTAKNCGKFRLILIGDGSLKESVRNLCEEKNISRLVTILDGRNDVWKFYNAFDLFCLPSHFEGLPVVLVEAQDNGLKCLVSDKVPREADISRRTTLG